MQIYMQSGRAKVLAQSKAPLPVLPGKGACFIAYFGGDLVPSASLPPAAVGWLMQRDNLFYFSSMVECSIT